MSNDELHDFSDVTPQEWRRLKVQVEREHTLTQWVDDQDGVVPAPHSENGPDSRKMRHPLDAWVEDSEC